MIYDILFAVVGVGLIAFGLSLVKLGGRIDSWVLGMLNHSKRINDLYNHQRDNDKRFTEAFKRIQELEDRLEAHATELTEHHNKIDTLEINGSVYESLFEQQGLWGENSDVSEFPKYNR